MKKSILITGENGYIGSMLKIWLLKDPEKYNVRTISLRGEEWQNDDFSKYDVVVHAVGLAHRKESKHNKALYYHVNRDLTKNVAIKAKKEGVKQFVFLSSMSVYGLRTGVIQEDTVENPNTYYGDSKLQAEKELGKLITDDFNVCIVRPPLVYGENCKGNYKNISKFILKTPIFISVKNQRSAIYIFNLCEFIKVIINEERKGVFHPQNNEYLCTSELVKLICNIHKKRLIMLDFLAPYIQKINSRTIEKIFGNLTYKMELSRIDQEYCLFDFESSVHLSERRDVNV